MKRKGVMIKRFLIIIIFILSCINHAAAQQTPLKREVTMYNPYRPSLNEARKISLIPDMTDTARFRPSFSYNVTTIPFMPQYTVSPIRPATLQSDPLDKLYKSFVNIGFGNYVSPLGEISITNERSKKGSLGFYGRHYSLNGKMSLENGRKPSAGYMDNDLSLFGKKFFKGVVAGASIDFLQRSRHAYGFDPEIFNYDPEKKDIRTAFGNVGATISVSSTTIDSSRFAYDFNLGYDHFYNNYDSRQNRFRLDGEMAKAFKGFFVGAGVDFRQYSVPYIVQPFTKYVAGVNPFLMKSTSQWHFKIGMQALLERNLSHDAKFHIYPDLGFGFSIVRSYVNFFASLTGGLEVNDPLKISEENPYLLNADGTGIFILPNTDNLLSVSAGLRGNTGIGGNYEISASYSLVNDMLFYANVLIPSDTIHGNGNYFFPLSDDLDLLTIHGGMTGKISEKISFTGAVNMYRYNLTDLSYAYNKPSWDASLGLKYNLRDKIIAGVDFSLTGERKQLVFNPVDSRPLIEPSFSRPMHPDLNLSAEYRYSRILSFWTSLKSISYQRYYEWAYYPAYRFMFMAGFTYSL